MTAPRARWAPSPYGRGSPPSQPQSVDQFRKWSTCALRRRHSKQWKRKANRVTTSSGDTAMPDDGRSRLGRGLAALMGDVGEESKTVERARNARRVPIE